MALAGAYGQARRFADEEHMLKCAFAQGHGPAAYTLAMRQEILGNHLEAARLFQEGVKFGHRESASSLWLLFANGYWSWKHEVERLKALGFHVDAQRASRYEAISEALLINPDLKLARIDEVLPLPPQELPPWGAVTDAVEPESSSQPTY